MRLIKNKIFNRIVIIITLFVIITLFAVTPISNANKLKLNKGDFYYAGTTKGTYVKSQSFWDWLIQGLQEVVDYLLGIMTMGGRMVFVGWTILLEKLLTWSLEATTGVPMDVGKLSSTDVSANSDSTDNITVEAIVYNKVPILNVNLFDYSYSQCRSGTGQFYVECETCYNAQNEGGGTEDDEPEHKLCMMNDCTCEECKKTIQNNGYYVEGENNPILIIKKNVSTWYYIMRLIAIAAMLIILLVVGIKMAISTISSEKALYKRMLVDWLVGFLILFTIHYIMIAIINLNESMVDIVKNMETGVTDSAMEQLGMNKKDKSNSDIEISIYEAVRTRAYDAKLINGTTGTILYMFLLYLAVRYTLKYLKRYFSVIVLTLMAPGVAFSYAISKLLTGKSSTFSNWFQEYLVTVLIQTIHAIIYTAFVSTALVISLNSISGMIVAFVILHYMLDFENIFRKIFRFTSKTGSDETSSAKEMFSKARTAYGLMTSGKMLNNSPIAKLAKAPAKILGTGAVVGISRLRDIGREEREERYEQKFEEKNEEMKEIAKEIFKEDGDTEVDLKDKFGESYNGVIETSEKELIANSLEEKEKVALENNDIEEVNRIQELKARFDKSSRMTGWDVTKAHLNNLFDSKNYFTPKANGKGVGKPIYGSLGKLQFNEQTGKFERFTLGNLVREQISIKNLLGFTKKDSEIFNKEVLQYFSKTLVGIGSLFAGFATVIAHPGVGFALIGKGFDSQMDFWGRNGRSIREPKVEDTRKKYSWNRWSTGAKKKMGKKVRNLAKKERNRLVVNNIRNKHPKLYKTLRFGKGSLKVLGFPAIVAVKASGYVFRVGTSPVRYFAKNVSGNIDRKMAIISQHHFKQLEKQTKEFEQEEVEVLALDTENSFSENFKEAINTIESDVDNLSEQQIEDEMAISAGDAVEENGEIVYVREKTEVTDEQKLISQAIVEAALSQKILDISKFDVKSNKLKIENIIEEKLAKQGVIAKGEKASTVIESLDKKIYKEKSILDKDKEKTKQADEVILEESIKEYIKETGITDVSKINPEELQEKFHSKKEEIMYSEGTSKTVGSLQKQKKDVTGENSNSNTNTQTSNSDSEIIDTDVKKHELEMIKEKLIHITKINKSEKKKRNSAQPINTKNNNTVTNNATTNNRKTNDTNANNTTNNRRTNDTNANNTTNNRRTNDTNANNTTDNSTKLKQLRRRQKLKRINELESTLIMATQIGEDAVIENILNGDSSVTNSQTGVTESIAKISNTDSVVQALLCQKEMRTLNSRGEKLKINQNGLTFRKNQRHKYLEMEQVKNGDRVYTKLDGSRNLDARKNADKEVLGPVSDIIDLINLHGNI